MSAVYTFNQVKKQLSFFREKSCPQRSRLDSIENKESNTSTAAQSEQEEELVQSLTSTVNCLVVPEADLNSSITLEKSTQDNSEKVSHSMELL